jgi:hypothetical protein
MVSRTACYPGMAAGSARRSTTVQHTARSNIDPLLLQSVRARTRKPYLLALVPQWLASSSLTAQYHDTPRYRSLRSIERVGGTKTPRGKQRRTAGSYVQTCSRAVVQS